MATSTLTAKQVVAKLRERQPALVDAYMQQLVPDYERHRKELRDMRDAGERVIDVLLRALAEERPIAPEELSFARSYLRRGLLRGATEPGLMRAAQLWQPVLWDALADAAGPGGDALVAQLSRPLIDYVAALSDAVLEAVESIQAARRLTAREGRRELIEELLAGRSDATATQPYGITRDVPVVVVSARPVGDFPDPAAASVAAVSLAHAAGDAVEPLFAVRGDEILIVRATPDDPHRLVAALTTAQSALADDGVLLAVGMSSLRMIDALAAAHGEAAQARDRVAAKGGVFAIAALGALDYLFLRGADEIAWNLVPREIRAFIDDDLSQAGLLIGTLVAYVECNMNVKQAAEQLFVHANTAHYRLAKIEELTLRDLRNLHDLQELVIAVRLARHRSQA